MREFIHYCALYKNILSSQFTTERQNGIFYLIHYDNNPSLNFMSFQLIEYLNWYYLQKQYDALLINTKKHKPYLIYIPVILTSLATFIFSSNNENYMSVNKLKSINNEAYSKLLESINDNNIYRTSNEDYILYNPNKVYDTNELKTSIYSSLSNKYYMNFIRNIFQNEVINRDNTTVTQTSNVLFNIYSNTKYLITSKNPPIGYTKINEIDNIGLYQNDSVLPLAYSSNKIMSLREFNTLSYPYTIDALLNYIIIKEVLLIS